MLFTNKYFLTLLLFINILALNAQSDTLYIVIDSPLKDWISVTMLPSNKTPYPSTPDGDTLKIPYVVRPSALLFYNTYGNSVDTLSLADVQEDFILYVPSDINTLISTVEIVQSQSYVMPYNQHSIPLGEQEQQEAQIATLLNRVPSVFMQSGALNTNRLSIRGIGARSQFSTTKIRAYLDDMPLTTGIGETTLEDIELYALAEVRIIKGPNITGYGAGLGGTILLKSKSVRQAEIQTALHVGSFGYWKNSHHAALRLGKKSQLLANYSFTHSDGYRDNNNFNKHNVTLLPSFKLGEKHELKLLANLIDSKAQIPSSLDSLDYINTPSKAASSWASVAGDENYQKIHLATSWIANFTDSWQQKTTLFGTHFNNYEVRPFNILSENNFAYGLRTVSSFDFSIKEKISSKLLVGAELFQERYNWQTYENDGRQQEDKITDFLERRSYLHFFINQEFSIGNQWLLSLGLNANKTDYNVKDNFLEDGDDLSSKRSFRTLLSPRVSLHYELGNTRLFGSVSHGFSPPTVEESLLPSGILNPSIQPETGWSYELGIKGFYPKVAQLHFNITAYNMEVSNLLVARRNALDQYIGVNAGKTRHSGIDFSMKLTPYKHKKAGKISLTADYAFAGYRFIDFLDNDNDYSGNKVTGTPPHQLRFTFAWQHPWGIYASYDWQYVAAMPITDSNDRSSDAFNTSTLRLGFQKTFKKGRSLHCSGFIYNIFDEKYASMLLINARGFGGSLPRYYYPAPPRNFQFNVAFRQVIGQ